jgi:mannose-1-phosphate guanylyltransferase
VVAVILAGGSGTRFWPLSRSARPKQCLSLDGGPSFLRRTVERLRGLVSADALLVVTGRPMEAAVRAELPELDATQILVEPSGRNTAPSIAWAVARLAPEGPTEGVGDRVVIVLPSDHHIEDEAAFQAALRTAVDAAARLDGLVTLGLSPTRPETGFGYLEIGGPVSGSAVPGFAGASVLRVAAFREKPDALTAAAYLSGGAHLWNAGMFVFRASVFWAELSAHLPRTAAALAGAGPSISEAQWLQTDAISVDYGVMERCQSIFTVPCAFGWSDVGSWAGAEGLLPVVEGGRGRAGSVRAVQSTGNVVWAPGRDLSLVGLHDTVVIDVGDAVLVMSKTEGEAMRQLLARLQVEAPDLT